MGAGGAGMWAAVEAVRAGKSVVVIEKGGNVGVANGSLAGGPFMVGSKLQQEAGVEFTVEEAFNHIMEYAHWSTNAAAVKAAVAISGETVDQFTDDFGVPTGLRPDNYGAGHASVRANFQSDPKDSKTQAKGEDRMKPLQEFVESKGGEFLFNTAGKRLIMEDGACTGVQCEGDGVTDVKAKAVIVATGGFSCNQEMVSTYLPSQARLGPLTVNSMGEGHQLCKAIGGVYTHMDMEANPHERPRSGDGVGLLLAAGPGNPAGPPLHQRRIRATTRPTRPSSWAWASGGPSSTIRPSTAARNGTSR